MPNDDPREDPPPPYTRYAEDAEVPPDYVPHADDTRSSAPEHAETPQPFSVFGMVPQILSHISVYLGAEHPQPGPQPEATSAPAAEVQAKTSGSISTYSSLKLEEPIIVNGRIEVFGNMQTNTSLTCKGNIEVYGSMRSNGQTICQNMNVFGNLKVFGSCTAMGEVSVMGSVTINGILECQSLTVYGSLSTMGSGSRCVVQGKETVMGSRRVM